MALCCSHLLVQVAQEGMKEIIGQAGVNAVFNLELRKSEETGSEPVNLEDGVSFGELASLQAALEELYGPRGGRGVALRAGRASFPYFLREFGLLSGLMDMDFRLLPARLRLRAGLERMARTIAGFCHEAIEVSEDERCWYWRIERCPECWERQTSEPCCHYIVGLLQEYMAWASGGKYFPVVEVECCAAGGAACIIQIEQQALD